MNLLLLLKIPAALLKNWPVFLHKPMFLNNRAIQTHYPIMRLPIGL